MFRLTTLATGLGVLALAQAVAAPASAEKLKVVASFSIIADFARNVGGESIELTTLVGPDGDAHVYEPRPADAAAFAAADVILVNGLQMEGFLQRLVEASGTGAPIVELTAGGALLRNADDGHHDGDRHDDDHHDDGHHAEDDHGEDHHDHGAFDPHAWQAVGNAVIYVNNIADAFCAADAAGCDAYRANADAYRRDLEALDAGIRSVVDEIPPDRRRVITSHDAFRYFAHEYGIAFLAPEGVSTESEASAADVAALIRQARDEQASAIFVETITNPRLVEQIAGETGLTLGGALYSDALSDESGPAPTYIDMMRHNIATIRNAITGS